jgi:hypothetical protein
MFDARASYKLNPGKYYLTIIVDVFDVVDEYNESNNVYKGEFSV